LPSQIQLVPLHVGTGNQLDDEVDLADLSHLSAAEVEERERGRGFADSVDRDRDGDGADGRGRVVADGGGGDDDFDRLRLQRLSMRLQRMSVVGGCTS
jgi:hypothetical protein